MMCRNQGFKEESFVLGKFGSGGVSCRDESIRELDCFKTF